MKSHRCHSLSRDSPQACEGQTSKRKEPENVTDPRVKIGIKAQDGDECYFRVPSNKRILSLLLKYCDEKGLEYGTVSFVYNQLKIKSSRTPSELGMEDGDMIDALVIQSGGGYLTN